jgi:glycosyltransferase involved in cell wall biosynthesis
VYATFQNISKRYPPPLDWFECRSLGRADGLIAFGRTAAEVLAGRGVNGCPVDVIPPGVDLAVFRPDEGRRADVAQRLGWSGAVPVVGFVGRLVPEKGIDVLLEAVDGVAAPWRALIVGGGPLEARVKAWARTHGDRVRLVTTAAHADVPAYLNAMDIVCVPSRSTTRWREQFGRVLIEAFASGVAVIASTSGEIPNVVDDAGLLLPEGDVGAWRRAIEGLIQDRTRRCQLARNGRRRAETVYAWPVVAQRHVEFFERVIAERRR